MATNDENFIQDTEMAECDGEKVVTMMDVLKEQQDFEEDANAVLGASDAKNCTYSEGYVKRQALYACITCCSEVKEDPSKRAGTCLACSLVCHENHDVIELYTKRNFKCDCGNPKFNSHPCQFNSPKNDLNEDNNYNQNFSGLYCTCHRPYPDPESNNDDDMIQCIICEDWYHATHLEAVVPANDQYSEMVCKDCMEKNLFLHDYSHLAVCLEKAEIDIINENDSSVKNVLPNENPTSESFDTLPDTEMTDESIIERTQETSKISIKTIGEETPGTANANEEQTNEGAKVNIDAIIIKSEKMEETESQKELESDSSKLLDKESVLKVDLKSDPLNNEVTSDQSQTTQIAADPSTQPLIEKVLSISEFTKYVEDTISQVQNEIDAEKLEEDRLLADPIPEEEQELTNKEEKVPTNENNMPSENVDMVETIEEVSKQSEVTLKKDNMETSTGALLDNINLTEDKTLSEHCDVIEENKKDDHLSLDNKTRKDENRSECSELKEQNGNEYKNLPLQSEKTEEGILKNVTVADQLPEDKLEVQALENDSALKTSNFDSDDVKMNSSNLESNQGPTISNVESNQEANIPNVESNQDVNISNVESNQGPTISNVESNQDASMPNVDSNQDVNIANVESNPDPTISNVESKQALNENTQFNKKNILEHKRKLSTEEIIENGVCIKKAKVDPCVRPKGIKKTHNGATFWPSDFRQKLCTCSECIAMYKDLSVLFLIDPEDTVTAYVNLGKEKVRTEGHQSQYEKGLEALLSLDRIQQINAVTEYNKLRDKLLDFLKSFKDRQAIVKEEDIKAFFAGMKPKRESDGVYFCR